MLLPTLALDLGGGGPVTCFSSSASASAGQCTLRPVAMEQPCLALPHISSLREHPTSPVSGSFQASEAKK